MEVAVLDDYTGLASGYADWNSLGPNVHVSFFARFGDEHELVAALRGFDVLCLMRERTALPRRIIEQLPDLKLVCTTGMRNAAVDIDYLTERHVPVLGTEAAPGELPPGVGGPVELAWSLIFALSKNTVAEDTGMREGKWQLGMPSILGGKTLGLAGLGRLGGAMVAPAKAFGMEVIAWSQNLTDERTSALGVQHVSKSELLASSDVLSVHLVLSDRTRGLFGATEIALMKPTALLINTSRGPIIEEAALLDALSPQRIGGAGLDVYDTEPLPAEHPLFSLSNTVLAPHLGYVFEANFRSGYGQIVEAIGAFEQGRLVRPINQI